MWRQAPRTSEVGRRQDAAGEPNPAVIDWRSHAALGLLHLGDQAGADHLAAQEHALAQRFGAPGPIGVAERVIGLVQGGDQGLQWLQRAVSTLEFSSARLEHARALVELGAARRRAGHRDRASRSLRDGGALAEQCGATALQRRALTELRATGARPRRSSLTGPQSLTTSELRVATLAAAERSNAHIAASLHISVRTVEFHLNSTYRKLGVHSRREPSDALGRGVDAPAED
jgi:DNA-binding CsgD family transcriptional regulator